MRKFFVFSFLLWMGLSAMAQQSLIPAPDKCALGNGTFVVNGQALDPADSRIEYTLQPGLAEEGYRIEVTSEKIRVEASTPIGMYRAKEALCQMAEFGKGKIRACRIEDRPRFGWRGFMLDESRHFFGKEKVKQYLDVMASLRMNVFHWHLTDETGWRVEIKRYPKLTAEGAVGNWSDIKAPARFYTQDEIREIVAYAAERHIMVVPEFDMPGHATALCRAYPEVSAGGEGRWKDFTFHPCKEETYHFIGNILDELFLLFPSPYIHLGGDEVHFGNQTWFTDAKIQHFIEENKLVNETGLEHYFLRRVAEMVAKKGRTAIVWDEAIDAGIPADKTVIMWWRHDRKHQLLKALEKGYRVILTPRRPMYADFNQAPDHRFGRTWDGFNSLEEVYNFPEPVMHLARGYESQLMGLQMSLWTERIADSKRLDYMTFPRLAAVAEDAWTAERNKRYSLFMNRLPHFLNDLTRRGLHYFNPFNPASTPEPEGPTKQDLPQF